MTGLQDKERPGRVHALRYKPDTTGGFLAVINQTPPEGRGAWTRTLVAQALGDDGSEKVLEGFAATKTFALGAHELVRLHQSHGTTALFASLEVAAEWLRPASSSACADRPN